MTAESNHASPSTFKTDRELAHGIFCRRGRDVTARPAPVLEGVVRFPVRTPTLPPATTTNSYALGTRDVVLVEPSTPYDDERRAWLAWARGLAGQGRRLVAIFVTHHHPDHVGGAGFLSRALDLPLWGHLRTEENLKRRGEAVPFARHLRDGDRLKLDGPTPQRWQVMHTPGHAADHLCLHEPELGVSVVGDMVASQGTIVIPPDEGDLKVYLEQLHRLADLEAKVCLPAHGAPIDTPRALYEHYVAHRLMRERKVLAALRTVGPDGGDLEALVAYAYDDTPREKWPLAQYRLRAHLDKLVAEGRAHRIDDRFVGPPGR